MNMLVLGGNGFIGSHLVQLLLGKGHKVSIYDINADPYQPPIQGVKYFTSNLGNRLVLAKALEGVDVVFHLISTTLPESSNNDPAYDITSNLINAIFLLEECVNKKVKKIVYISSGGTVYGIPSRLPVHEEAETNPLCSYGITKLAIEKYLSLFNRIYGLNYVILRPSNPYGERQPFKGKQGVISSFLHHISCETTLEIWGDGSVIRDFIYVGDLIRAIYSAGTKETASKVFNIGSGSGISINHLVQIIRDSLGEVVRVEYKDCRKFDVPEIYLDTTKANLELDWTPEVSLDSGIRKTWQFIKGFSRNQ